jgi:hypothetical protein
LPLARHRADAARYGRAADKKRRGMRGAPAPVSRARWSEGVGRHPPETGQRTTPATVSSIDSIGKQLPLLCATSGRALGSARLELDLTLSALPRSNLCKSYTPPWNSAVSLAIHRRHRDPPSPGSTCHGDARSRRPTLAGASIPVRVSRNKRDPRRRYLSFPLPSPPLPSLSSTSADRPSRPVPSRPESNQLS